MWRPVALALLAASALAQPAAVPAGNQAAAPVTTGAAGGAGAAGPAAGAAGVVPTSGFIKVSGPNHFVDANCGDFIPLGWNSWVSLNKQASQVAAGLPANSPVSGSNFVTKLFDAGVAAGFNTVRIFGHGEDVGYQLQTAPGVYNEYVSKGIDYVLAVAALRNIKVIFVTVNNWLEPGVGDGKLEYVTWGGFNASAGDNQDFFWTNPAIKGMVKNHYKWLSTHVNYFTGVTYANDPTIFAWDLFNEMRNPGKQNGPGKPAEVTAWINEMAAYFKSLGFKQLLTVGEEGFFDANGPDKDADPWGIPPNVVGKGRYWSGSVGQDFASQHSSSSIDFAAFHMWPDNWFTQDVTFPPVWIQEHIKVAGQLGKPLVLEEFGKSNEKGNKDQVYDEVYSALEKSLASDGVFRGALFWRWALDGGSDTTTVYNGDSTFAVIERHVAAIKPYMGRPVAGCSASGGGGAAAAGR